jgi:hypothetical protein
LKPSLTLIGLHASKEKALLLEDLAKHHKNVEGITSLAGKLCEELQVAVEELRQLV